MGIENYYNRFNNFNSYDKLAQTFKNYIPQNESQARAVFGLRTLSDYLNDRRCNINYGIIIGLQGQPGTGKTHLTNSFINSLKQVDIEKVNLHGSVNFDYSNPKVVVAEDLGEGLSFEKDTYGYKTHNTKYFKENLFKTLEYTSENNGVFIFTTGINIKNLFQNGLEGLARRDQEKIRRILMHPHTFEITGEDYRDSPPYKSRFK